MFREQHSRSPDPIRGRGLNDRLQRRKLFDRNPIFTTFCDKIAVEDFVTARVGPDFFIPRPWVGEDPTAIPFGDLPYPVVVKPSHLSGWVRFLHGPPSAAERDHLRRDLATALRQNHGRKMAEPAYYRVPPRVIVEQLLPDDCGNPAADFKFWCFHGRAVFIQYVAARHSSRRRAFRDTEWRRLAVEIGVPAPVADDPAPPCLGRMVEIAETIGAGFDFIRVDLYESRGRPYFGEITVYPHSGIEPFTPVAWDHFLGDLWCGRIKIRSRAELREALAPFYAADE